MTVSLIVVIFNPIICFSRRFDNMASYLVIHVIHVITVPRCYVVISYLFGKIVEEN